MKRVDTDFISHGTTIECYGELLGEERQGMQVMFQMMNAARPALGLQGLASTRYFIKNVLPEVDAVVKAIKSADMFILEIPAESFAS
jgi:hypothetical protein